MRRPANAFAQVRHGGDAVLDIDAVHIQMTDSPTAVSGSQQENPGVRIEYRVRIRIERLESVKVHWVLRRRELTTYCRN
ncbi:hypothetical protein D3C78_1777040 [compost metagenome]